MRRAIAILCLLAAVAGCARPPAPPQATDNRYRLDTGDRIRVIVYNEPSLSTEYAVGDNGTISVPMIGDIKARSQTTDELREAILNGLRNGILVNPSVSVEIVQFRPFFVVGEVGKPGQYPYAAGLNALAAVAIAGGFTVRAGKSRMTLVRNQDGAARQWRADAFTTLMPGDVLVVPESFF